MAPAPAPKNKTKHSSLIRRIEKKSHIHQHTHILKYIP